MQEEYQRAWVGLVIEALVISILSNIVFGASIGSVSCKYTLSYSPSNAAFLIWILVYSTAFFSVFFQLVGTLYFQIDDENSYADYRSNLFFALAWFFASLWVPVFTLDEKWSHVLSATLLCLCSSFSLAAMVVDGPWAGKGRVKWANATAFSLLAGWTLTASTLSLGIAYRALYNSENLDKCDDLESDYNLMNTLDTSRANFPVPLILAIPVALLSVWMSNPIFPLPLAWAIFFMHYTHFNFLAFVILIGSSVNASIQIYM
jgi:hypothetical protein